MSASSRRKDDHKSTNGHPARVKLRWMELDCRRWDGGPRRRVQVICNRAESRHGGNGSDAGSAKARR